MAPRTRICFDIVVAFSPNTDLRVEPEVLYEAGELCGEIYTTANYFITDQLEPDDLCIRRILIGKIAGSCPLDMDPQASMVHWLEDD